ncbi:signal peptidase I [Georgenia satyanarayanai]|uniref:Signal peptidase I n=1 Tax=Georgenia satyanarayanai TaxID=860221 RepID=A0A2Y9A483_9MICO|nr:signal peptidase I [Georgenia satyanarayanai]PYG00985.1 signal peptidase I [Georgenia satyanarayanai]SSA39224.1 signal peptidase I [Georgenia satyanarayanai]
MSTATATPARHRVEPAPRRPGVVLTLVTRVLPGVLLVALLALLGALILVPRLLGWAPLTVLSGSMEPTIPTGSQVVISPVADVESLEVGDVVTVMPYPDDPTLVTHRIVARAETPAGPTFTTQGDANDVVDPWEVTETQLRGEVRYWVPAAGYLATALSAHTKAIGTAVIAAALFAYAALQVVRAGRERRTDEDAVLGPVVDRERLTRLEDEVGHEAAVGMVERFVDMLPTRVARLHEAVTAGEAPELRDASLSLGGTASMLGADKLAEVAATCRAADAAMAREVLAELDRLADATGRELVAAQRA